jgi:hypothetical protein
LYWVVPIPKGGLAISPDGQTATLEMENVAVVDQPKWPALDAVGTPAIMSFRMIWKATDEKIIMMIHRSSSGWKAIARQHSLRRRLKYHQ